jgi:hypothetical protein
MPPLPGSIRPRSICGSRPFVVPIRGLDPFSPGISNYLGEEDLVVFRCGRADSDASHRTGR